MTSEKYVYALGNVWPEISAIFQYKERHLPDITIISSSGNSSSIHSQSYSTMPMIYQSYIGSCNLAGTLICNIPNNREK